MKLLYSLSLSILYSLLKNKNHYAHPVLTRGEVCFTSLRMDYLRKLLGILLHRRFVSSRPCIHLFKHLFILALTRGYSFYTLGHKLPLLYFVTDIVPTLGPRGSFRSAPRFPWHAPRHFAFWALLDSLAGKDPPGSSCLFPVLVVASAISLKNY